jgi:putative ABC transport system substrate-binding protein
VRNVRVFHGSDFYTAPRASLTSPSDRACGKRDFSKVRTSFLSIGRPEAITNRLSAFAFELAEMPVDVIAAFGSPAARAAKVASQKSVPAIPVVFTMASDPVIEGYVQSLNRPGGNITGVTSISAELAPKRLELMRELLPNDAAIGFLINPSNPLSETERKVIEAVSIVVGQQIVVLSAGDPTEIDKVFASLPQRKVSGVIIASDVFFYTQMQRMAGLAAQAAIPVIGPLREFAIEGGLLSYGASIPEVNRQGGIIVGKILKGQQPAELPVQQPRRFELIVNLKAAKALGIEFPPKLLAVADEVIE